MAARSGHVVLQSTILSQAAFLPEYFMSAGRRASATMRRHFSTRKRPSYIENDDIETMMTSRRSFSVGLKSSMPGSAFKRSFITHFACRCLKFSYYSFSAAIFSVRCRDIIIRSVLNALMLRNSTRWSGAILLGRICATGLRSRTYRFPRDHRK